jgi:hypothetical protein
MQATAAVVFRVQVWRHHLIVWCRTSVHRRDQSRSLLGPLAGIYAGTRRGCLAIFPASGTWAERRVEQSAHQRDHRRTTPCSSLRNAGFIVHATADLPGSKRTITRSRS